MSDDLFFESVDKITLGTVGSPGERTFYLQARSGEQMATLIIEKDHAISLGQTAGELLTRVGPPDPAVSWTQETMALDEDQEPLWRVGEIGIGYEEDRDLVLLICKELVEEEQTGATAQFWLTREQLSALGSYGLVIAAQGRPLCPFCTLPVDPEGHECPAVNGHRKDYFGSA